MSKWASNLIIEALKFSARGILEVYILFFPQFSNFLEVDSKFSGEYYLWVMKN